jgi:hypothetical protein
MNTDIGGMKGKWEEGEKGKRQTRHEDNINCSFSFFTILIRSFLPSHIFTFSTIPPG